MIKLHQGGFLISKIHQIAGRIFTKKLKETKLKGINSAQGRILFPLWQNDNISIQELSKKTALSKSTLTRMLDKLEESGHIMRTYCKQDRRKIMICLTDKNKKMKKSYEDLSIEMIDLFYDGFTESEIDKFESQLKRILNNLEKYSS